MSEKKETGVTVPHIRHSREHCLAIGLFRSLKKGDRKKMKLDITYWQGDKFVRFVGFEPLGVDDLKFLQAMIHIAGPEGCLLEHEPETPVGKQLREMLELRQEAVMKTAVTIETSCYKILQLVGMKPDSQSNVESVKESLIRMSNVTVIAGIQKEARESYHLISHMKLNDRTGRFAIALNPMIGKAILGGQHVFIDMNEVRALKSDPARLIHQRLCAWIDLGKSGKVDIETLCAYAWADPSSDDDTVRWRRSTARKALQEIKALGWGVSEYERGRFEISRPK
jgi:hypothetical protein